MLSKARVKAKATQTSACDVVAKAITHGHARRPGTALIRGFATVATAKDISSHNALLQTHR